MNKIFFSENLDLIEHKLYEKSGEWCRLRWAPSFCWIRVWSMTTNLL